MALNLPVKLLNSIFHNKHVDDLQYTNHTLKSLFTGILHLLIITTYKGNLSIALYLSTVQSYAML